MRGKKVLFILSLTVLVLFLLVGVFADFLAPCDPNAVDMANGLAAPSTEHKVLIEENEYAYSGVRKIVEYIEKQYSYKLTIDERLYLLIHIKRILDEQSE